jgi:hypoxanthine phosphoribosyltransferase
VQRLGAALSERYDDGVVLVGLLKGSVVFLADLVRAMTVTPRIAFLGISPFAADSGRVRITCDLDLDIGGRDVVLVEAVVDTGFTTAFLLAELGRRDPRSLAVCALIDKHGRRVVPVTLDHVAFTTDADYVVGYGLDHAERYRNAPIVAAADPVALAAEPDLLVPALYGRG